MIKEVLEDLRKVIFQVSQEKTRKCPFRIINEIEEIKKRGIKVCPAAGSGCTLEASRNCQFFLENKEKVWEMLKEKFPFPTGFCSCLLFEGMQGSCDISNRDEIIEKLNERLSLDSCWLRVYWEGEEMVVCLLRELSRFYGIEIKIKKSYLPVD